MGSIWLRALPQWLAEDQRLVVKTVPGWETRSRSSGGYEAVRGIIVHHDASAMSHTEASTVNYLYSTAATRPIGALYLGRTGTIYVGAAGATNCAGKGGPLIGSKGRIPLNDGNRWTLSIEAGNNGIGERWAQVQVDAYVRMVAILCERLGLDPWRDIWSHRGYCQPSCPGRKIDPFGPVDGYPTLGPRSWDDNAFRALVAPEMFDPARKQWSRWRTNVKPAAKQGDSGPWVAYLQGLVGAQVDGVFGPQTEAFVRDFQRFFAGGDEAQVTGVVEAGAGWGLWDFVADIITASRKQAAA